MARQKRGSKILETSLRRAASLRSISETFDLGNGLSLAQLDTQIQDLQEQLSEYNTMLSVLDEMASKLAFAEEDLSDLSSRMLLGIASYYGKDSVEYLMAGGKPRKLRSRRPKPTPKPPISPLPFESHTPINLGLN